MQPPRAAQLLDACDAGIRASPAARTLLVLEAWRSESRTLLERRPLGWLVARLLELRAELLGTRIECLVNCPQCNAVVETELAVPELVANAPPDDAVGNLHSDKLHRSFRLPTAADLLQLKGEPARAARQLALALLSDELRDGEGAVVADLSPTDLAVLESEIAARDPLACIELVLDCPECGHRWSNPLRPFEFVWIELNAWCRRLVLEVARLATAFGWSETEILAMSEARRRRYLELLPV